MNGVFALIGLFCNLISAHGSIPLVGQCSSNYAIEIIIVSIIAII